MTKDKSNIRAIRSGIKIATEDSVDNTIPPDEDVVSTLKFLLEEAEAGKIQHLVFVGLGGSNPPNPYTGIVGDLVNMHFMLAHMQSQLVEYTDMFSVVMGTLSHDIDFDDE